MLASELRGRLAAGSGEPARGSDPVDALLLGSYRVLVSEVAEVLAVRLSSSLWNLRFVVASAGGESAGTVAMWCCCRSQYRDVAGKVKPGVLEWRSLFTENASTGVWAQAEQLVEL